MIQNALHCVLGCVAGNPVLDSAGTQPRCKVCIEARHDHCADTMKLAPQSQSRSGRGDEQGSREERWRAYLREVAQGVEGGLDQLYSESCPLLYSFALRLMENAADAEEVVLDVYSQVWRTARRFDEQRCSVWGWLEMITRSRAIDRLRSRAGRRFESVGEVSVQVASPQALPDQESLFRQQDRLMRNALQALPVEQREAIELAYFSELTHAEVATRLQQPLGTVKTRIRLGMLKLREWMEAQMAGGGQS